MTTALLSPKQKEVWQAIIDYINGAGKRFYAVENPYVVGDVLIAPRYGEGIKLSDLKGLERCGLIDVRDPLNKSFRLSRTGQWAIEDMHLSVPATPKAEVWYTVIIKHADEPDMNREETCEGIPAGFGYLSPLLEAPDFVRVEFVAGLTHTTIIKME